VVYTGDFSLSEQEFPVAVFHNKHPCTENSGCDSALGELPKILGSYLLLFNGSILQHQIKFKNRKNYGKMTLIYNRCRLDHLSKTATIRTVNEVAPKVDIVTICSITKFIS